MFRNTLRMLEQLNGTMTYKMDVLPDEDGYYDKECPNEKCLSKFKVNAEDWKNLFSDDAVSAHFVVIQLLPRSWWTTEQIEQAGLFAKIKPLNGLMPESSIAHSLEKFHQNVMKFSWAYIFYQSSGQRMF